MALTLVRSNSRHASADWAINSCGCHENGKLTTSTVWLRSISASRSPSTSNSAPPRTNGTCVAQIRMRFIEWPFGGNSAAEAAGEEPKARRKDGFHVDERQRDI